MVAVFKSFVFKIWDSNARYFHSRSSDHRYKRNRSLRFFEDDGGSKCENSEKGSNLEKA